jgi:hypothetical protein
MYVAYLFLTIIVIITNLLIMNRTAGSVLLECCVISTSKLLLTFQSSNMFLKDGSTVY